MQKGTRLKVELEDGSGSGILEVLRVSKEIRGLAKEIELVDCKLVSGKIPSANYKETKRDKDKIYILRVKDLREGKHIFRIQGFIK